MATIDITRDALLVNDRGLDRDLAFRGQLEVPLINVVGVAFNPDAAGRVLAAFRQSNCVQGAASDGQSFVGALREQGDCIVWDVRHASRTVIIELDHDRYAKIIVEVPDAAAAAARLQSMLDRQRSAAA